ncbi:hypothetical protein E3J62_11925 [candidate division TA06 bacterium]|uniref:Nucleotidyltransferase domain-containing protein n=1 Tax=candidate division TA06 bacterium TaxID=2250710 RepID=A0A523UN14_UNCT6|nr:MAG: hypothetical protein E3J62_11925 [candidate division TA06 bacterium]
MMGLNLRLDFKLAQREEADTRMKEYLVKTVEGFFDTYPERKVRSLILTGGMSRGEGSCELSSGGALIYSDYDLLVVPKDRKDVAEARSLFPVMSRSVTDSLRGEEFCSHVDFAPITTDYLKNMSPSMFNVELAEHGKVVWGDDETLSQIEKPEASEIPLDDALTLLFNRIAAQLVMIDPLRESEGAEFEFAFYHNGKIFLDIVSCILVLEHNYRPTYAERLSALLQSSDGVASRLQGLLEEARFWTHYKLDPNKNRVREKYSPGNVAAGSSVVAVKVWNLLVPKMEQTLGLCLEEAFGVKDYPLDSALITFLRRKNVLRRLREYRTFLHRAAPAIKKGRIRPLPFFMRGTPLDMTYAAATMLFFSVDRLGRDSVVLRNGQRTGQAALFLPVVVPFSGKAEDWWEELREATTELWRVIVKGGAY